MMTWPGTGSNASILRSILRRLTGDGISSIKREMTDETAEEPQGWRPPVACPQCGRTETRFVTLNYEMSVYVCEGCGVQFETDEREG